MYFVDANGLVKVDPGGSTATLVVNQPTDTNSDSPMPDGLAHDGSGNLYFAATPIGSSFSTIYRTQFGSTSATALPSANGFVHSGADLSQMGMTCDASGNLWFCDGNTIAFASASSLASANPTATDLGIIGNHPMFDSAGNLFYTGVSGIYRITSVDLLANNYSTPTLIAASSTELFAGSSLAFDAGGNLFLSDLDTNGNPIVSMVTAAQIAGVGANGAATPTLVLSVPDSTWTPSGLAFDLHDNLFVGGTGSDNIAMATPAQRAAHTYTTVVNDAGGLYNTSMVFVPVSIVPEPGSVALMAAAGLPLMAALVRRRRRAA